MSRVQRKWNGFEPDFVPEGCNQNRIARCVEIGKSVPGSIKPCSCCGLIPLATILPPLLSRVRNQAEAMVKLCGYAQHPELVGIA
jgi:hypothetical protein